MNLNVVVGFSVSRRPLTCHDSQNSLNVDFLLLHGWSLIPMPSVTKEYSAGPPWSPWDHPGGHRLLDRGGGIRRVGYVLVEISPVCTWTPASPAWAA